jgi:hypothetical protein
MGELIDPADPEYEWKVAEQYQAACRCSGRTTTRLCRSHRGRR